MFPTRGNWKRVFKVRVWKKNRDCPRSGYCAVIGTVPIFLLLIKKIKMTNQNQEENNKPKLSKYARYSSLVIQMGVLIAFFTWLGTFLDKKFHSEIAWWTIGLSLFGVFAGLYLVIKDVINSSKEDEK